MRRHGNRALTYAGSIFIASSFALTAWLFATPVRAFTVGSAVFGNGEDPNHEMITQTALNGQSNSVITPVTATLTSGKTVQFSSEVVARIVQQNVDTDSADFNVPKIHFDDETFTEGNNRLIELRARIRYLVTGVPDPQTGRKTIDYGAAQATLGTALHTLQDFYSHSTWVEQQGLTVAPLGDAQKVQNLPVPASGSTCSVSGLSAGPPFTSEYFDFRQLLIPGTLSLIPASGGAPPGTTPLPWNTTNVWQPPFGIAIGGSPSGGGPIELGASKCIHGVSYYKNSDPWGSGINKDNARRDNFDTARIAAIAASQTYVNGIIQDIQSSASIAAPQTADKAICGLLTGDDACGELRVLVQTGSGASAANGATFAAFDSKVSVNSNGEVAFSGSGTDGSSAGYLVTASGAVKQLTFTGGSNRVFQGASVNDAAQAAFLDRVSGSPPTWLMRRWASDGSQSFTTVGTSTSSIGFCAGGTRAGQSCLQSNPDCPIFFGPVFTGYAACIVSSSSNFPFNSASFFQSLNDAGVIAFPALVSGSTETALLAGSSAAGLGAIAPIFPTTTGITLRPQISNTLLGALGANVVYLDNNKNISVAAYTGNFPPPAPMVVASATDFSGAGQRPGISSDGQFVAFAATGSTVGPAVLVAQIGNAAAPGPIPVPMLDTSGSAMGASGKFTSFNPNTRYAIAATQNTDKTYTLKIVFDATKAFTDSTGTLQSKEGVYVAIVKYDSTGKQPGPKPKGPNFMVLQAGPGKILQVDDPVTVSPGTIKTASAFDLWEPLSRKDGSHVAFWVAFKEGGNAIVEPQ